MFVGHGLIMKLTELGREQGIENHAKVKLGKWLSELSVCCLSGGMAFGSPAPTQGTWEAETGIPGISWLARLHGSATPSFK